ncbi:MAG: hypothetical protein SVK08_05340, partial [Halobacteriota archaeon]|nr:hypothetical protein [Halobacteriota archaeon]
MLATLGIVKAETGSWKWVAYLVIYELIEEKGYARTVDISSRLNVQPPSVTEMIQRMDEGGYLIYEKYRGLKLT